MPRRVPVVLALACALLAPAASPATAQSVAPSDPLGKPAARVRRGGVLAELWVSSATIALGEPVAILLRVTNLGRGSVYHSVYPCESTEWLEIDARAAVAPGIEQTGNAAALKGQLVADVLVSDAERGRPPRQISDDAIGLADCSADLPPAKYVPVGRGGHRDYRWWWMAPTLESSASSLLMPLGSGPVTFSATWLRSPGHRLDSRGGWRKRAIPVTVSATVNLVAPAMDIPSVPELVDIALADPLFRAWVDGEPSRHGWEAVTIEDWHPPMDAEKWFPMLRGRLVEVVLERWTGRASLWEGIARVDAVAHRVTDVRFECPLTRGCEVPAWSDPPWLGMPPATGSGSTGDD